MATTTGAKSATIAFSMHDQNLETINKVVASIVGRTGCRTCGRLLNLALQFQGDPGPDLTKEGVTSVQTEGF